MGELDLFAPVPPDSDGAWQVADVTRRARSLIEQGFERIWVRGEVTGVKTYRSGHWYFTLRDRTAQVRCVMWRTDNQRVHEPPAEGLEVFVEAQPTVWEERGEFRLTVKRLLPTAAEGSWQLQLAKARAALERDGLLDPARKRPLPSYPTRIAVVTSTDGAALRDIVSVMDRRWPVAEVWVVPTRVQGEGAEREIARALTLVNRLGGVDLLIVGRGGGSREDLWAFNTELVARALARVRVPTVSAVGHETDYALTDLVADVRAPTPSAAAEAAVPDIAAVRERLGRSARGLVRGLEGRALLARERLERTGDRLSASVQLRIDDARGSLDRMGTALDALSPLRVLARGYAVPRTREGVVLRRIRDFVPGAAFRLTVTDGEIDASVGTGDQ